MNVPSRHLYAIQMQTVPTIPLGHSPALVEQAIQEMEEQAVLLEVPVKVFEFCGKYLVVLVFHHNDRIDLCQC